MPELRAHVDDRLRRVRGLVVSDAMFGTGDAYWCNGKEVAHFESNTVIEVRLTKAEIRERRGRPGRAAEGCADGTGTRSPPAIPLSQAFSLAMSSISTAMSNGSSARPTALRV